MSGGMAWPSMGVGWAGESYAAAQRGTGGGSRRYRRRWFGRLKQEYRRLKKKHDIRWMDIQRPQLPEPCVVDKALHTRQLSFFRGFVNLEGPQVYDREHIAHLRFVRMYNPFFILMEFTTT